MSWQNTRKLAAIPFWGSRRSNLIPDAQIDALRRGDLATCFGPRTSDCPGKSLSLAGGTHETGGDLIVHLDPTGGRYGLGLVRGEADIHPNDWF